MKYRFLKMEDMENIKRGIHYRYRHQTGKTKLSEDSGKKSNRVS